MPGEGGDERIGVGAEGGGQREERGLGGGGAGTRGTPRQLAATITDISRTTFASGMHNAFLVAAAVALAGAVIALFTRRGDSAAGPTRAADQVAVFEPPAA